MRVLRTAGGGVGLVDVELHWLCKHSRWANKVKLFVFVLDRTAAAERTAVSAHPVPAHAGKDWMGVHALDGHRCSNGATFQRAFARSEATPQHRRITMWLNFTDITICRARWCVLHRPPSTYPPSRPPCPCRLSPSPSTMPVVLRPTAAADGVARTRPVS